MDGKDWILKLGMIQREIANKLNISRAAVSELATGNKKPDPLIEWALIGLASKNTGKSGAKRKLTAVSPLVESLADERWSGETARLAMPILIQLIKTGRKEPITYGELHEKVVSLGGKANIGTLAKYAHPCGRIARAAEEAADLLNDEVPPITAIVVNGTTGLPSPGIDGFLRNYLGRAETKGWTKNPMKRREAISQVWEEVFAYKRWGEVQTVVGLTGDPQQDR